MDPLHLNSSLKVGSHQTSNLHQDEAVPEHVQKIAEDINSKFSRNLDLEKNNQSQENQVLKENSNGIAQNNTFELRKVPIAEEKGTLASQKSTGSEPVKPKPKKPTMRNTGSISEMFTKQEDAAEKEKKGAVKLEEGNIKLDENVQKELSKISENTQVTSENTQITSENIAINISKAEISNVLADVEKTMDHAVVPKNVNGQKVIKDGKVIFIKARSLQNNELLVDHHTKQEIYLQFGNIVLVNPKTLNMQNITGILIEEEDGSLADCKIEHLEEEEVEKLSKSFEYYFDKHKILYSPPPRPVESENEKNVIIDHPIDGKKIEGEDKALAIKKKMKDYKINKIYSGRGKYDELKAAYRGAEERHDQEILNKIIDEKSARIHIAILKFERNAEVINKNIIDGEKITGIFVTFNVMNQKLVKEAKNFTGRSKIIRQGN